MKNRVRIFMVITIIVSLSVSVIFYNEVYNSNINGIEARALEMDTLNQNLQEVSVDSHYILQNNKQWRLESLYNEKLQRHEYVCFLESCIIYHNCTQKLVSVGDNNTETIRASIKTSPVYKNDCIASKIVLEYDYEYNLLGVNEYLLSSDEYFFREILSLKIKALCLGMLIEFIQATIILVAFKKKA